MLRGRILRPAPVVIVVTACIDRFAFCLATSTIIRTVAVAGTSSGLLILENPCMAAARGAGPRIIAAVAMVFVDVCPVIYHIMALITFSVLLMSARSVRL